MTPIAQLFRSAIGVFWDRGARLVHDLLALASGQLLSKAVGIVAFGYIARTVDPAAYGQVEYVVGLAAFFAIVIDCGLGPVGVRRIAQHPEMLSSVAAQIPAARLVLAGLVAPVMVAIPIMMGYAGETTRLGALYAISLFGAAISQEWLLQSRDLMVRVAVGQTLRACVFLALVALSVHGPGSTFLIGVAEIASVGAMVGFYIFSQHTRLAGFRLEFRPAALAGLAREGASLGAANVVWALQQYAPIMLVAAAAGPVQTAWFAAPQRIVLSLLTFSNVYHFNLYPMLSRLYIEERAKYFALLRATLRVSSAFAIGGALAMSLLARTIMQTLYGADFAAAASPFAVLVWALPITLISGHARWALTAARKPKFVLFAQLAGALAGLASAAYLIPAYGAFGAALAVTIMSIAVLAFAHASARHCIKGFPALATPALFAAAGLAILAVAGAFQVPPALEAVLGLCIYTAFVLILHPQLKGDLLQLIYAKKDIADL